MITAVDTNIILDILIPAEPFAGSSKKLLDRHLSKGSLIIGEVVFAELSAHFPAQKELGMFLSETGIRLVYSKERSLYEAGARWAEYSRKSKKGRFLCAKCGNIFEVVCPRCTIALPKRLHVLADFFDRCACPCKRRLSPFNVISVCIRCISASSGWWLLYERVLHLCALLAMFGGRPCVYAFPSTRVEGTGLKN